MIKYDKLFSLMEKNNISSYYLIHKAGDYKISSASYYSLKNNENVNILTLYKLSKIFNCEITDLFEFVEDNIK